MMAALLLSTGAGCGSTGHERAATDRFEGNVTFTRSAEGGFMLAVEERTIREVGPMPLIRFLVYDTAGDSVVYERMAAFQGSVRWEDPGHVRVQEVPGIVMLEGPSSEEYLIDVRTHERMPLSDRRPARP